MQAVQREEDSSLGVAEVGKAGQMPGLQRDRPNLVKETSPVMGQCQKSPEDGTEPPESHESLYTRKEGGKIAANSADLIQE